MVLAVGLALLSLTFAVLDGLSFFYLVLSLACDRLLLPCPCPERF